MPLFEYRCPECHHLVERLITTNPPPDTTPCLCCCEADAARVASVASFQIKGTSCH
jgi:putative FmdB family regulatory protein